MAADEEQAAGGAADRSDAGAGGARGAGDGAAAPAPRGAALARPCACGRVIDLRPMVAFPMSHPDHPLPVAFECGACHARLGLLGACEPCGALFLVNVLRDPAARLACPTHGPLPSERAHVRQI